MTDAGATSSRVQEDTVVASKPKNENKKPVSKAKSKKDVIKGGKNSTADAVSARSCC